MIAKLFATVRPEDLIAELPPWEDEWQRQQSTKRQQRTKRQQSTKAI